MIKNLFENDSLKHYFLFEIFFIKKHFLLKIFSFHLFLLTRHLFFFKDVLKKKKKTKKRHPKKKKPPKKKILSERFHFSWLWSCFFKGYKNFCFFKAVFWKSMCGKHLHFKMSWKKHFFWTVFFWKVLCSLRKGIRLKEFFWKDVIEKKKAFLKGSQKKTM